MTNLDDLLNKAEAELYNGNPVMVDKYIYQYFDARRRGSEQPDNGDSRARQISLDNKRNCHACS